MGRTRHSGILLITLACFLFFIGHVFSLWRVAWIERFELFLYDQKLNLNIENSQGTQVAIANIDEKSIKALGQWPWRRDVLAQLLDTLFDHYQVKAVGFDMVFSEASDNTPLEVLNILKSSPIGEHQMFENAYQALHPQLNFDLTFAESLQDRNVVLGIVFHHAQRANVNALPLPVVELPDQSQSKLINAQAYIANLPIFHETARWSGFFDNPMLDDDGVFRRVPLVQRIDKYVYPSLALSLARIGLDSDNILVELNKNQPDLPVEAIQIGTRRIKTGEQGEIYVPYRGQQGSFRYFSIVDLLQQNYAQEDLKNKIILVGTDATGLLDLRTTPFANTYPGVEVHANIVSGILENRLWREPDYLLKYEVGLLVFFTLVMLLIAWFAEPRLQLLFTILILVAVLAISQLQWQQQVVMPTASLLGLTLSLFVLQTIFNMLTEVKQKALIVKRFGQYVPPAHVKLMVKSPERYQFESQNKELTVLFSDIRDFTSLSEKLTPEELSKLMNRYLTVMTQVIHKHRGTIDKYMGDAIMAFWGAPLDDKHHVQNAANAAYEMMEALSLLNMEFESKGWPKVNIGIGINTDNMFVGDMGSEFRMAYTVMGDAVNLASRLEGLTKQYGADILVGQNTQKALLMEQLEANNYPDANDKMPPVSKHQHHLLELDIVRVKGKHKPVAIFQLDPLPEDKLDEVQAISIEFARFCLAYRQQEWETARLLLNELAKQELLAPRLILLYQQRLVLFKRNPPGEDWDGVFNHTAK
ncbi:adenylate/guanylate cyclase domain-containing protein [Saccharobesus litoralis]|uniref:Adenylate/guanylate cyclase domain-containing protein n=1 Tax=Saccharobesus litoralis TaxID=2172099 RepID=A0A2S0VLT5_9ALTE|nr:adenylate/guanylate cyclase domain-containing protein [Saccharobesus litoralis]AWB65173.1 adenylate/guanylate cyclase domain-containing protein [Saccharobesus litoralis]